jgi:hypothetical protein
MAEEKGKMTVSEAGRKGGKTTSRKYGREFYEEIGHKGGQRVKELIELGKKGGTSKTSSKKGAPREA